MSKQNEKCIERDEACGNGSRAWCIIPGTLLFESRNEINANEGDIYLYPILITNTAAQEIPDLLDPEDRYNYQIYDDDYGDGNEIWPSGSGFEDLAPTAVDDELQEHEEEYNELGEWDWRGSGYVYY
ncbi:unnamed protein product [Cylicocyclus nassatus]|uniref:Uncharacterized protein n=1 Tax=Cylicocyclus nassatus TaxID=53992 RepID=A0AA36GNZ7_CYLNA|nr:unnamed protein product [Cylicocyclus nassatus]